MQIEEPDKRQLRYFGASLATMLAVLAALARWQWHSPTAAIILLGASLLLALIYYTIPTTQRRIFHGFRLLTFPIQRVATAIILALVFYLIITPIGLILRARGLGIRPASRKHDSPSFWTDADELDEPDAYFRTY